MSYTYAYLLGCVFLGGIWALFFFLRKDLRHQLLFVSLFTAPLAPMTQVLWFYRDYWRPDYVWTIYVHGVPLGLEEVLFAFFIGGIGSVLYEVVFRKKYRPGRLRRGQAASVIGGSFILISTLKIAGWNAIWASTLTLIIASLVIVYIDRDLRKDWIMSSIGMFVLIMFVYWIWLFFYPEAISRFWVSTALSGHAILSVPIEEVAWFVSWAMFSGIAYEFAVNAGRYRSIGTAYSARRK